MRRLPFRVNRGLRSIRSIATRTAARCSAWRLIGAGPGRVASGRTARNLKHEKRPQVPRHAVCVLFRTPAHRECPSTPYYTPYLTYNIRVPSWIRCLVDSRHGQQHRSCQSGLDLSPRGRIHAPCLRAGQNGKGGGLLRKESRKSLFVWHSLLRCHWPAVRRGRAGGQDLVVEVVVVVRAVPAQAERAVRGNNNEYFVGMKEKPSLTAPRLQDGTWR